jgi:hypothetical protein
MSDQELRDFAKKRLKKQAEFKRYLWIWVAVSVLMTVIYFLSSPGGYFWPAWVIFGMGVGALFQGIDAYSNKSGIITDDQVDAEVQRLKGGKSAPAKK